MATTANCVGVPATASAVLCIARAFVIDATGRRAGRVSWQRTAELLLAAAEGSAEIEAATQQIERALFPSGHLAG
jgi:hypothetical protein